MAATPDAFPMFPLGMVLLPTAVLPLHVFEPRYRELVADCLAGEREFGVTLIERGHEVGGDDVRSSLGTIAQILEARESPDGRWFLGTVGTRRFKVTQWLEDDPYPRAVIEDWPDAAVADDLGPARASVLDLLEQIVARVAQLQAEPPQALPEVATDAALASYQISAMAPVGPLDRQSLLAADGPGARFGLLERLLAEQLEDLRLRIELEGA
jgi:Lon protease-like protein